MIKYIAVVAVFSAVALSACGESAGPATISLQAQLANAGASDRAMLVQIVGTDTASRIDTVTAPVGSSYTVYAQRQSNTGWRAIIAGNLANGAVLRLIVPGKAKASAYSASILDVADAVFADLPTGSRALSVTP
jgi:hypothetical protein